MPLFKDTRGCCPEEEDFQGSHKSVIFSDLGPVVDQQPPALNPRFKRSRANRLDLRLSRATHGFFSLASGLWEGHSSYLPKQKKSSGLKASCGSVSCLFPF